MTLNELYLLSAIFISIFFIIFIPETPWEEKIKNKIGLTREWWLPSLFVILFYKYNIISYDIIKQVFIDKIDIIVLILSFSLLAKGLGDTGYFRFVAFKIVSKSEGNTNRLILYLYFITSIFTYFTSNDIVILVMTPILIGVAYHIRLINIKLLLMSQFIAANMLSMGLLIGSPSNMIIADDVGLDFLTYMFLMTIPAILAFAVSFITIDKINHKVQQHKDHPWYFSKEHMIPLGVDDFHTNVTKEMSTWMKLFGITVFLVFVLTELKVSLLPLALFILVVSFYFLLKDDVGKKKVKKTKEILVHIPMGVLFFGVSFFILTYAFATSPWVSKEVIPLMLVLLKSNEFVVSFFGIFSSGFLVNIFNDLPAANLLGVVLGNSVFLDVFNNSLLLKSVLFGLNIGCIVTPIGALAGIVWFHLIKVETSKYKGTNFIVPTKIDLFKYGTLIFFVVGTISAMILPTFLHVYKFIIGPVN